FDKLIVAVGRRPFTENLLSGDCGVNMDERGFIHVDETCRTDAPGIWAIGDVVRGPMLAYKAPEEGVRVAERIAGHEAQLNYSVLPAVMHTLAEIALVGNTAVQVRPGGLPCVVGMLPSPATGRATASLHTDVHVMHIAHAEAVPILGASGIGRNGG